MVSPKLLDPIQDQVDLLNEEIALVQLEIYDTKLEELDLEAALNFRLSALANNGEITVRHKLSYSVVLLPSRTYEITWPS
jgi:hypothetical protein